MTELTIVCLTYNHEKFIKNTIEGIINQKTSFKFELIISDDCSTDNTINIIKEYAKQYKDIIRPIFHKKNIGSMKNFINSLSNIDTKYVAICDGDDCFIDVHKLQKQYDFMEENEDYNICFTSANQIFEDNSVSNTILPRQCCVTTEFNDLLKENYIITSSVFYRWQFRNQDMNNIIPYDIVPGDYYLHLLHAHTGKIRYMDEIMVNYIKHSGGIWCNVSKNYDMHYLRNGIKIINFYINVNNRFNLNDFYDDKLNELFSECIRIFLRHDDFKQLYELQNVDKDKFNKNLSKNRGALLYPHLNLFQKVFYRVFFR